MSQKHPIIIKEISDENMKTAVKALRVIHKMTGWQVNVYSLAADKDSICGFEIIAPKVLTEKIAIVKESLATVINEVPQNESQSKH